MARHVWRLRSERCYRVVEAAFGRTNARGLVSITHYSVQGNHIHLLVESRDGRTLSGGIKGLEVRLARALNALMGTSGRTFGDRYHAHELTSPNATRTALAYVLKNLARHDHAWAGFADPFSSASAFAGWSTTPQPTWAPGTGPPPIAAPTTWLLTTGWRKRGLIDPLTIPGGP
jgi:hypothetical protein